MTEKSMIGRNENINYNEFSRVELFHQIAKEVEEEERMDNQILASQKKVNNRFKKPHPLHL